MDSAALVSAIQLESGLDATSATALSWLNSVYQSVVAGSRYRMAEITTFGPTVAGQDTYVLDDQTVVEVEGLLIGGSPYERRGTEEIFDLKAGLTYLTPGRKYEGVFAPEFTSTGATRLIVYPAPSASGTVIQALVALEATVLDGTSGTSPILPPDLHQDLVDAAISLGKARLNGDGQARQEHTEAQKALTDEVSRRKNARVGGSGPTLVDMSGF